MEKHKTQSNFMIKIICEEVKNIEFFSKSDPFLRIFRLNPNVGESNVDSHVNNPNSWVQSYETEHVQDDLNPIFKQIVVDSDSLCDNDIDTPIKIEIWDHSSKGKHTKISYCIVTVNNIIRGVRCYNTIDEGKKFAGRVRIVDFLEVPKLFDMQKYVDWGVKFQVSVAIDMSSSNGDPNSPHSLHYLSSSKSNQYQLIMKHLASHLMSFDVYQRVQFLGFGAEIDQKSNDCFLLSLDDEKPFIYTYKELEDTYVQAVCKVTPSNSNTILPIIHHVSSQARKSKKRSTKEYHILLIITDGISVPKSSIVKEIVESAELPLSIIIAGVGRSTKKVLSNLDGDSGLNAFGKKATRDIVQFINFRDYVKMNLFVEDSMKELPGQIYQYYRMIGDTPTNDNI